MSIASYAPGSGGLSAFALPRAQPSSSQSIPQPILHQGHDHGNVIDTSFHGTQRGDLTGDDCYTVNICDNKASIWLERSQKIEYLKSTSKVSTVSVDTNETFDKEKISRLSSMMISYKEDAAKIIEKDTEIWTKKEEEMGIRKKKKIKTKKLGLTLVVPCGVCMNQSKLSRVLVGVRESGLTLKNIFNEGIASIAGLLYTKADSKDLDELKKLNNPCIMYVCERENYFEGALISCDGGEEARKLGNTMGYDRLCTIAMAEKSSKLSSVTERLLDAAKELQKEISTVAISGKVIEADLPKLSCKLFKVDANTTTAGGCILSAAELDSSKQYMNLDEGVVLAYQFSIADSLCSEEIGMSKQSFDGEKVTVEQIYSSGERVWKNDIGPIRPGSNVQTCLISRSYKWGNVYFRNKNDYKVGWPDVRLHHRKKGDSDWTPFREIRPLTDRETGQPVESCTSTIQINPHTGEVFCTLTKGRKVSDIKGTHKVWMQIIGFLLFLVALVGAFFLFRMYHRYSLKQKHIKWLIGFYTKNAPDKLKDMTAIMRTIEKYNDKMFILWRTLERTYNTKWPAPEDILDEM